MEVTTKKLYLVPAAAPRRGPVADANEYTVRVSVKDFTITFPAATVQAIDLGRNWLKWYLSPQQGVIAWKLTDKLADGQVTNKQWRKFTPSTDANVVTAGCRSLVAKFDLSWLEKLPKKSASFVVRKYKEVGALTEEYYYITLKESEAIYKKAKEVSEPAFVPKTTEELPEGAHFLG